MSMNGHLYRSRDDRMLAGVAGGVAELWDADPSLVRIVWALLVLLTGGLALVVYIVMAIVVPEDDGSSLAGQAIGWTGAQGQPPTAGAGAPAGAMAGGATSAESTPPSSGGGPTGPGGGAWTGWPQSRFERSAQRRAERSAARTARREARGWDGRTGATLFGILLILVGAFYLLREFLPTIDFDWFWPLVLVAVGVVVLVLAIRPRPDNAAASEPERRSDGS
jgi:phage shock protein PspC (stress-responsive transcriptional regulator)